MLRNVTNDYLTHVKYTKGITLIALIITVVVLVIIAGTAVTLSIKQDGIFTKSNSAVSMYNERNMKHNETVSDYLKYFDNNPNRITITARQTGAKVERLANGKMKDW